MTSRPTPKTLKSRAPSIAIPEPGAPTPERQRRNAFAVSPAVATDDGPARAGSRVYRAISTVERMLRAGSLEPRQAEAADRLRDDFELGLVGAREPASGSGGSTGWFYAEARLAAVRRYKDAMVTLGPTALIVEPLVIGVPGRGDVTITALARSLARNRQEIAGVLKVGLDLLACHYGIDG